VVLLDLSCEAPGGEGRMSVKLKFLNHRKAALGCMAGHLGFRDECGGGIELHHPREGVGAAQKSSDWLMVPLCWNHHHPPLGVHSRKSFYGRTKLDEYELLAETIRRLEESQ
jgi:hypothetical protein